MGCTEGYLRHGVREDIGGECVFLRLCTIYSNCKKTMQRRLCLIVLQEHQILYSVGFSYRVCLTVYSVPGLIVPL